MVVPNPSKTLAYYKDSVKEGLLFCWPSGWIGGADYFRNEEDNCLIARKQVEISYSGMEPQGGGNRAQNQLFAFHTARFTQCLFTR